MPVPAVGQTGIATGWPCAGAATSGNPKFFSHDFSAPHPGQCQGIGLWLRRHSPIAPHALEAMPMWLSRKAPWIVSKPSLRSSRPRFVRPDAQRGTWNCGVLPLHVPKQLLPRQRRGGAANGCSFQAESLPWRLVVFLIPTATGGWFTDNGRPVITEAPRMEHLDDPTDAENG